MVPSIGVSSYFGQQLCPQDFYVLLPPEVGRWILHSCRMKKRTSSFAATSSGNIQGRSLLTIQFEIKASAFFSFFCLGQHFFICLMVEAAENNSPLFWERKKKKQQNKRKRMINDAPTVSCDFNGIFLHDLRKMGGLEFDAPTLICFPRTIGFPLFLKREKTRGNTSSSYGKLRLPQ